MAPENQYRESSNSRYFFCCISKEKELLPRKQLIHDKKRHPDWDDVFIGDPERTRTVDLQRDRLAC